MALAIFFIVCYRFFGYQRDLGEQFMAEKPVLGSREHLESIFAIRSRGISRKDKLPAVILYLYTHATRGPLGLVVEKGYLRSFMVVHDPFRRDFLYALDAKEQTIKKDLDFGRNLSCICIEYECGGAIHQKGTPIERVRLLQPNVFFALRMVANALNVSSSAMFKMLGCTEEELVAFVSKPKNGVQCKHKEEADQNPGHASREKGLAKSLEFMRFVTLRKGSKVDSRTIRQENLSAVLKELCRVQSDGVVTIRQFGSQQKNLKSYFLELANLECLELVYAPREARKPLVISKIRILKDEVPKSEPKKIVAVPKGNHGRQLCIPEGFALVGKEELALLRAGMQDKPDTRCEENAALVFVDVPNLMGYRPKNRDGEQGKFLLRFGDVNWFVLFNEIKKGDKLLGGGLNIVKSFAYSHLALQDFNKGAIVKSGFTLIEHDKDIDPLMSGDIGVFGSNAIRTFKRTTLVIVTGDGDYAHVLSRLREEALWHKTSIKIWVISWGGQTKARLKEIATLVSFLNNPEREFLGGEVTRKIEKDKARQQVSAY